MNLAAVRKSRTTVIVLLVAAMVAGGALNLAFHAHTDAEEADLELMSLAAIDYHNMIGEPLSRRNQTDGELLAGIERAHRWGDNICRDLGDSGEVDDPSLFFLFVRAAYTRAFEASDLQIRTAVRSASVWKCPEHSDWVRNLEIEVS